MGKSSFFGSWLLAKFKIQKQNHTADCTDKHGFLELCFLLISPKIRYQWESASDKARARMAKASMTKEEGGKEKILAAIRRAASELGRAPSRGELRRITGVSHYRVLAEFPTLREAVRAAGLEPNPKGEKISTEDLLADWKRLAEKLGRRPSRAEYVREGRYSAGALTVRFGSWSRIENTHPRGTETRRKTKEIGRELRRKTRMPEKSNHKGHEGTPRERNVDFVSHNFSRVPLARVPSPLVGMRRVTEAVAQLVVNTLLAHGNWQLAISQNQNQEFNHKGHEGTQRGSGIELALRGIRKEGDLGPSLAVNTPLVQDDRRRRADFAARGLHKDRPVWGSRLTGRR